MLLCLILMALKMMKKMIKCNVLITSAGRRVSLVKLFKKALQDLNINGFVYAIDVSIHAPALYIADKFQIVRKVTDSGYIDQLINICEINEINLIIPTIDTELNILSKNTSLFTQKGIKLLVSDDNVNDICKDKRNTERFFYENNIPAPAFYNIKEAKKLIDSDYPLMLKPSQGSSSVGVTKINNQNELLFFYDYTDDAIIQDYIEGDEYTIDILIDFEGKVRCAVPRLRMETRAGEVSKAITINNQSIIDWSYKIAEALKGSIGCITIQCIKDKNEEFKFIEINPRFGGGFPLSAQAGANFPRWILQMLLNINLDSDLQKKWNEGQIMLRYDEGIFTTRDKIKL